MTASIFEIMDDLTNHKLHSHQRCVVAWLRARGEALTAVEIASAMGTREAATRLTLEYLAHHGFVARNEDLPPRYRVFG